jgi:hypothetical protein
LEFWVIQRKNENSMPELQYIMITSKFNLYTGKMGANKPVIVNVPIKNYYLACCLF